MYIHEGWLFWLVIDALFRNEDWIYAIVGVDENLYPNVPGVWRFQNSISMSFWQVMLTYTYILLLLN